MTTVIPKTIALVDWLHMLTVQIKVAANDKDMSDHNRAGRRALAQLHAVRSSVGQEGHVIVCLDSPPYWRKKIYPEYKGTRAEREPEFASILEWTLQSIVEDGFALARAPNEEADDVAATLARVYSQEYGCTDVRLVGADKDGLQCVSERVRLFVPKERGEFDIRGPEWLAKEYGVKPSDFALLLAIMGDKSDNIGGIEGLGKANGAKLINAYKDPEGMAKGLTAAVEAAGQPGAKPLPAVWKNYAAGMGKLPLWWKLTTLNTEAAIELHPLKYLERIEGLPAFEDDEFNPPTLDELEEERRVMAATLPVGQMVVTKETGVSVIEEDFLTGLRTEPMRDPEERRAAMAAEADRVMPLPNHQPPEAKAATEALGKQLAAEGAARNPYTPELSNARSMVIGKDPKADAALRAIGAKNVWTEDSSASTSASTAPNGSAPPPQAPAPSATAAALSSAGAAQAPSAATPPAAAKESPGAAQVVSPSRGPQKPRQPKASDGIDQNALAVRVDTSWELSAQPSTAKEMMQIAETVFQSPMFRSFGTPYGTFAIIALGREMGFGWMQSLMAYYDVNGRPFMGAHAMRGKILAHPDCDFFVNTECTAEASTWVTRRKSWPKDVPTASYRFTYAEAVEIGLTTGKNAHNWTKNKRSMIDKYSSSHLGRQVWADVIGGMHSPEEEH